LLLTQPALPDRVSYILPCYVFENLRQQVLMSALSYALSQFTATRSVYKIMYSVVIYQTQLQTKFVYRFLVLHNVPVLRLEHFKITKVSKLSKKYVSNVHYTILYGSPRLCFLTHRCHYWTYHVLNAVLYFGHPEV